MTEPRVEFEILLRSAGSGRIPTTRNVEEFRPDAETIELVLRWLQSRGVEARPTGFSLACSAPPAVFQALFGAKPIAPYRKDESWRLDGPVRVPAELADAIEDVTLSRRPELF